MVGGLQEQFLVFNRRRSFFKMMRIRSRQRNLFGFALVALVGFGVTFYLVPGSSSPGGSLMSEAEVDADEPRTGGAPVTEVPPANSGTIASGKQPGPAAPADPGGVPVGKLRGYALPLAELRGLSPNSVTGSRLEIWVAWRKDLGRDQQVQRVVTGALLGAVREATLAEGPQTVELFIPVDQFPEFLAAHEFGSLNAAIVP